MVNKTLPNVPVKIDDYRLKEYYGHGKATEFLCNLIECSNGLVIQKLVTDRLLRKGYSVVLNDDTQDYYDCTIGKQLVEIRRTTKKQGGLYLYMGNTSRSTNTEASRQEKVMKMINGGYLLTRVMNNTGRLLMYWLPTMELVKAFDERCFGCTGINIVDLNERFNLDIPLVK